jgi:hypothetical protein
MACEITQESLGPAFADVDEDLVAQAIEDATIIVLGPAQCQAEKFAAWLGCCLDPCLAIKKLAQHILASDPASGAENMVKTSESVGDVSVAYASADSGSGLYKSTPYGLMFSGMLAKFERCGSVRQYTGMAFAGRCR